MLQQPVPGLPDCRRGPVVLSMSSFEPDGGQHLVIQAFHVLKTYLRPDAQLLVVATASQLAYAAALKQYVYELVLPDVTMLGQVSRPQLPAIYECADLVCCPSAHQDGAAALLQSMAFEVPIVAWPAGAVTDTLGNAVLWLKEPRPTLVAEAFAMGLADQGLRAHLIAQGRTWPGQQTGQAAV